jgi:hypothetical protein
MFAIFVAIFLTFRGVKYHTSYKSHYIIESKSESNCAVHIMAILLFYFATEDKHKKCCVS